MTEPVTEPATEPVPGPVAAPLAAPVTGPLNEDTSGNDRKKTTDLLAVLGEMEATARRRDRPKLAERLATAAHRMAEPSIVVLVVGEYKNGKSSLVNALIDAVVCPVDDDLATAVPTFVRFGDTASATVHYDHHVAAEPATPGATAEPAALGGDRPEPDRPEPSGPIPLEQLAAYVTERGNPGNQLGIRSVDVTLPHDLLREGIVLVDTPGVGGLGSAYGVALASALGGADAVVFVSSATEEYTRPEIELLKEIVESCPDPLCALTKIDLYSTWRKIQAINEGHLADATVQAVIYPVSCVLHQRAVSSRDPGLDPESGIAALRAVLSSQVVVTGMRQRRSRVGVEGREVIGLLRVKLRAELDGLDPAKAAKARATAKAMHEGAEKMVRGDAGWRVALQDGMDDLTGELPRVAKDVSVSVFDEIDQMLDQATIEQMRTDIEPLIQKRFMEVVTGKQLYLQQRIEELTAAVTSEFAAEDVGHVLGGWSASGDLEHVGGLDQHALKEIQQHEGALLKHSMQDLQLYQGAVSALLNSMWGISLNPISLGFNVLLSTFRAHQLREQQLQQIRDKYREATRHWLEARRDDLIYGWRGDVTERRRALRDYFGERAAELMASSLEAVKAAQHAQAQKGPAAIKRAQTLRGDLAHLQQLEDRLREASHG